MKGGDKMDIEIWTTNMFNGEPVERVALFSSIDLAKDFVNYKATLGERFAIKQNGQVLELD